MPQYLDDNGNPIAPSQKTYLDPNTGEPVPVPHQEALGLIGKLRSYADTSLAPNDNGNHPVENTLLGAVHGIANLALHPVKSFLESGANSGNYPGTAYTGYKPADEANANAPATDALVQNANATVDAAKENPAYTVGSAIGPILATVGIAKGIKSFTGSPDIVPGQNYDSSHASAFEGALAPSTAMGKNFIPQEVTPEALSAIRATASRMATGTPAEQEVVNAATGSSNASSLNRVRAYRTVVNNALQDLESQHAPALTSVLKVPIDTTPIVQKLQSQISPTMDAADVSAIRNLIMRVKQAKTIGDLNTFRQELNVETAPEYRQSQVQAGRSGLSSQATSDLAGWVRNSYYDNLQRATGIDFAPLKRQEANLITVQEALQNQASPLAKAEATFNAPTTLREKVGNVANVVKDPKTAVTQTILRESPATKLATLLQKSLQDLPAPAEAPAVASVAAMLQRRPAPALSSGSIELPAGASTSSTPMPPPYNYTTRAQRLGLLLPQQTGGPIELPYVPEMSGGEKLAALMQYIRSHPQPALPAKASALITPPPK